MNFHFERCEERRTGLGAIQGLRAWLAISKLLMAGALVFFTCLASLACGPWFPNTMLMDGDATLLEAPLSDFQVELNRIQIPNPRFEAVLSSNALSDQTFTAELADLQSALAKQALPGSNPDQVLVEFQRVRATIREHAASLERWRQHEPFRDPANPRDEPPRFQPMAIPDGLPGEFADYLNGTLAFYSGETNAARRAWEGLLERPPGERGFRSTWAVFMLGKTDLAMDPARAVARFRQVRDLVHEGFQDSVGLAASSYGWEAKAELAQGHFAAAAALYLAQQRAGDPSAALSLRFLARKVIALPHESWVAIASDPLLQQVVTAYLVSRRSLGDMWAPEQTSDLVRDWLTAVEQAGAVRVPGSERLALAAYQRGLFDEAQRWLQHAPANSAAAQWLRAKFLLRNGDAQGAAKLLSQVIRLYPREGEWIDPPVHQLVDGTPWPRKWERRDEGKTDWDTESPVRRAMGELGVLQLSRRDYYEALDTLLRAGYWTDAAYVAENVLDPDELLAYVGRQWPDPEPARTSAAAPAEAGSWDGTGDFGMVSPGATANAIRYLLARRLARLSRWDEAVEFYPPSWRSVFESFHHAFERGHDQARPASDRAAALWEAAQIARRSGMELFGTEVEPDWHVFDGQFDWDHVRDLRATQPETDGSVQVTNRFAWDGARPVRMKLTAASADERRRLEASQVQPNERFHYRYYAADLAWEAGKLMPDNTPETARVLWRAGSWLKNRDPQAADRFYKALVRRCRRTPLGEAADRLRWFPKSDEPAPSAPPETATPLDDGLAPAAPVEEP